MNTLRLLAILTIAASCAPQAALAQAEPGGLETASFTRPALPAGPTHRSPETCPYQFDSDMPARTFCVYMGVARGGSGEECATDVVVIWSSVASRAPAGTSTSDREVYLGFVAAPELVVRAIVDPGQNDRAEILEYTLGSEEAPQPLAGRMTLPARLGSVDVLSVDLREPRHFHPGSCAFASYSGRFLGVIRPPNETSSIE